MRKGSPEVRTKESMEKMRERTGEKLKRTGEKREITQKKHKRRGREHSVLANFTHTCSLTKHIN